MTRLSYTDCVYSVIFRDPYWLDPAADGPPVHVTKHVELDGVTIPAPPKFEVAPLNDEPDYNVVVTFYLPPDRVAPPALINDDGIPDWGGIDGYPVLTPRSDKDDADMCPWEYNKRTGLVKCTFYARRVAFE